MFSVYPPPHIGCGGRVINNQTTRIPDPLVSKQPENILNKKKDKNKQKKLKI